MKINSFIELRLLIYTFENVLPALPASPELTDTELTDTELSQERSISATGDRYSLINL
ncbi:MAG: hypothetical protein KME15_26240 [Drouetiella hepatica Uher 2000/2452]|jgi:hypothetical protein|uniref:Uncharacterized protein n=1 Tax=Drouetiella hepatica Uher 2000/2452 TaxID=904376 RepID=A0A951QG57_9CYAN|nr:hypothetical protein [Drouetiella hepatica Uher 2000/2452]